MAGSVLEEEGCDLGLGTLRVLVIEDSADDFELILRTLQRAGHAVTAHRVEDESELIVALANSTWDVVLVDWVLPRFSAPDALRILQQLHPSLPCIVVSGSRGEDIAVMSVKLGARDFITKEQLDKLPTTIERELLFDEGVQLLDDE